MNLLRLTSTSNKSKKPDVLININEHKIQAIGIRKDEDNDVFLIDLETTNGLIRESHSTEAKAKERVLFILQAFGLDDVNTASMVQEMIVR